MVGLWRVPLRVLQNLDCCKVGRDERAFRRARETMFALPIVETPLGEELFSEAVSLYPPRAALD